MVEMCSSIGDPHFVTWSGEVRARFPIAKRARAPVA
jgi:hypothetical protein